MDVDKHAVTVNVPDFQVERFLKAQATGVDCEQEGPDVRPTYAGKNTFDFLLGQYGGKLSGTLSSKVTKDVPLALQDLLEKEAHAAVADAQRSCRPFGDVFAVEKVLLQFVLGDEVGGFTVELHQQAHLAGIGVLGALRQSGKLQGLHRSFVPVVHHVCSPLEV